MVNAILLVEAGIRLEQSIITMSVRGGTENNMADISTSASYIQSYIETLGKVKQSNGTDELNQELCYLESLYSTSTTKLDDVAKKYRDDLSQGACWDHLVKGIR